MMKNALEDGRSIVSLSGGLTPQTRTMVMLLMSQKFMRRTINNVHSVIAALVVQNRIGPDRIGMGRVISTNGKLKHQNFVAEPLQKVSSKYINKLQVTSAPKEKLKFIDSV